MPSFDEAQRWVFNNGFAVVVAIMLLLLLRLVIKDAIAHFNTRLDQNSAELSEGFREMARAVSRLDSTLDRLNSQAAANHEALTILLQFVSHTQQEVVAHRTKVEGTEVAAPSPPVTVSKDG